MKRLFKPEIIFLLIIILSITLNWYGNINKISYYQYDDSYTITDTKEKKSFEKKRMFETQVFDVDDYKYWKERKVNVKKTRTLIPFGYHVDTIADTGWQLYRKKY